MSMQRMRQTTEYEFLVLCLSDMRGNRDRARPIAAFRTEAALRDWVKSQEQTWTDEPSTDNFGQVHTYGKAYRKGSPLEWFNPPSTNIGLAPHDRFDAFGCVIRYWTSAVSPQFDFPLDPPIPAAT